MKHNILIISILLIVSPLPSACQKDNQRKRKVEVAIDRKLVLNLINAYRTSGCDCGTEGYFTPAPPVTWNDTLEMAAKVHSSDMFSKYFFSHTGSDGSVTSDRIKRLGYNWTTCGENIGKGYKNEEQVVKEWIKSPEHCSNIMYPGFKEIGAAKIGDFWTLVLATH